MQYVYDSIVLHKQPLAEMHLNLFFIYMMKKGTDEFAYIGIAELLLLFTLEKAFLTTLSPLNPV